MPPKRAKLDPDTKAQRHKEASACYRAKNPHLRDSARERMARLWPPIAKESEKKTAQAEEERRRQEHIERELKRSTTMSPSAAHNSHPSPHCPTSAVESKTRRTLDAHPPSDDELQLLPLPSPKEYHSESDVDSDGSARSWGPIYCPCVRDERCEKCRICRCRAWWCKEDHPPKMRRTSMFCPSLHAFLESRFAAVFLHHARSDGVTLSIFTSMSDIVVPCLPEYWPDKRHFRGKEAHSADPKGRFFCCFQRSGTGVYTTMEQVNQCLRDFEGGVWAQASTWDGIVAKWKENCRHHHSHLIDLSPHSSVPSTPATRAPSTLPDISDTSSDTSDDSLLSPHRIPPALPFVAATDCSLLPQLQQELAAARLDAAISTAEASAQRIAGLVTDAEAAVRRIGVHAEVTFGHLQRASSAARFIGQWADQALEVLAEARLTAEQALPGGQSANVQDD
ncbi:hypothetical protein B0H14DRAFT_2635083 [Mycena olivaceomarginata]|nr:hypothetical protein B0H14DRAFT_2635083 [Mycena olivaceomarginata]